MEKQMTPEMTAALILVGGGFYLYAKNKERNKLFFCLSCHHAGSAKTENKGHILIEIILWFAFLVPGLLYSIWRRTNQKEQCKSCNSMEVIPSNSPRAIEALKRKT